jgi:hypothetical protein
MKHRFGATWLAVSLAAGCAGSPAHVETPPAATLVAAKVAPPGSGAPAPPSKDAHVDRLAKRVGTWDVVMTMRPSAHLPARVVSGVIAERALVSPFLRETMRPAPGSAVPEFTRIDYLTFNTSEGRWQYLSMDTRAASVGLMFARAYTEQTGADIELYFSELPVPRELGTDTAGRYLRSRHVLSQVSGDHELVRQYWTLGDAPEWLAVQYEYTRRSNRP